MKIYPFLMSIHMVSGSLALLSATVAMITTKGQIHHRRWGMIYGLTMMLVSLTAWIMSWLKPNPFLFMIACFSAYMVASGYARSQYRTGQPRIVEYMICSIGWMTGIGMLLYAFLQKHPLQIVMLIFGCLCLVLAFREGWGLYHHRFKGARRIAHHLAQMLGGTIATVTAVAVVNFSNVQPAWLMWLLPSVMLTPVIVYWNIRILKK